MGSSITSWSTATRSTTRGSMEYSMGPVRNAGPATTQIEASGIGRYADVATAGDGIFAQRFDKRGGAAGEQIQVNTRTNEDQRNPSIAMDREGNFVIPWDSWQSCGSSEGTCARKSDAEGHKLGDELQGQLLCAGLPRRPRRRDARQRPSAARRAGGGLPGLGAHSAGRRGRAGARGDRLPRRLVAGRARCSRACPHGPDRPPAGRGAVAAGPAALDGARLDVLSLSRLIPAITSR